MRLAIVGLGMFAAIAATLIGVPAAGQETPVDLELVLAVDISGSVDHEEALLQRQGYLAAVVDPAVVKAIQSGYRGVIALTYVEWAGAGLARIVADWTPVRDAGTAEAFAARISDAPIDRAMWTSISGAIDFALPLFENNGFAGSRRVIDISGDGANNSGRLVTEARDRAVAARVTINGLPIVNDRPGPYGSRQIPDLDLYYRHCVIGGTGAFIVVAEGFGSFAAAIRKKLIFEIAGILPPGGTAAVRETPKTIRSVADGLRLASWPSGARRGRGVPPGLLHLAERAPPPCDIGERRLEQRRRTWDDY